MVDVLEMPSEDVAIALGRQDDRLVGAYEAQAGESRPKPSGSAATASAQERLF